MSGARIIWQAVQDDWLARPALLQRRECLRAKRTVRSWRLRGLSLV